MIYNLDDYKKELDIEENIYTNIFSKNLLQAYHDEIIKDESSWKHLDMMANEPREIYYEADKKSRFKRQDEEIIKLFNDELFVDETRENEQKGKDSPFFPINNIILIKRGYFNNKVVKTICRTERFLTANGTDDLDYGILIPYWVGQFEQEVKERFLSRLTEENLNELIHLLYRKRKFKWFNVLSKVFENNKKVTFGILILFVTAFEYALDESIEPINTFFSENFNERNKAFFQSNGLSSFMQKMVSIRNRLIHEGLSVDLSFYNHFCNQLFGCKFLDDWINLNLKGKDDLTLYLEGLPFSAEEKKINDLLKGKIELRKLYNSGEITSEEFESYVVDIERKKRELETL